MGPDQFFSITFRNTLSPWSSSLPEDLMVHNNSQDENISLLTEVWPCSMSRELSVRPYLGNYLQTSMNSLFRLMYFFPFWQVLLFLRLSQCFNQTVLLFMVYVRMFLCILCKPLKLEHRRDIFHSHTQISSRLMITHSSKFTLCAASY